MRALVLDSNPGLSEKEVTGVLDRLMLAGPPEDMPVEGISPPPMEPAKDFAKAQNELLKLSIEHGIDKDTRRLGVAAREFEDIHEPLAAALGRAGIRWEEFLALDTEGVTDFMLDLPSRASGLELMWRQHDNTQTTWHPND
jgi:hypothetical protein